MLNWVEELKAKVPTRRQAALLLATAKVEEVENVRYFGAAYRAYMQRTKMFIPFVF